MDETNTGNTSQQAEAQGDQGGDQAAPATVPVERFNQVYAQMQEQSRTMDELRSTLGQTTAALAAMQAQRQAPVQQEPQVEIDPSDAQKIDYIVSKRLNAVIQPLTETINELRAGVRSARVNPEVEAVKQQLAKIGNPVITARTMDLMSALEKNGALGTRYRPDEVLQKVVGEFSLGQLMGGAQNQQEQQQYNGGGFTPIAGQGRRPAQTARPAGQGRVASNLADKPLDQMNYDELQKLEQDLSSKYPGGVPF